METPIDANAGIKQSDIAVIGMSCRFPGAATYQQFWENLKAGVSSIQEVPGNRWNWQAYWGDPQTEKNKSNSKWGGFLKGVDSFDPDFFGLSITEVERMDPQQRIMLELAWSCFEDAGIRPADLSGKKAGVFLGVFNFDYKELQEHNSQLAIEAHHSTGTASALIANRISYYFNLKGPSFPIDTACSSSLSAIHSAIQSLMHGECTLAVAGGINLLLTPTRHISFSKTGMLSPTGSCKTFDDHADGYVRGEGAGLVLLKPLAQAIADEDIIYGIIKGSAVNHGGKTYSLTYPNPQAQKEVIVDAQKMAGITADSISYIEAHGTGTPKGDPIELEGLVNAFQLNKSGHDTILPTNYCGLGSVKTNVGHLEAAAGVAGIIKVLLSMRHKQLPGLQNFTVLNHRISLENSPFYLVTELQEWKALRDHNNRELPRRAGVSSFGFGGTNAHVVLEEALPAQVTNEKEAQPPYYLVCMSAKTAENLLQKEKDLAAWLATTGSSASIEDICKTLSVGREHFQKRTAFIVGNTQQLEHKLAELLNAPAIDHSCRNLTGNKEPAQQLFIEVGNHIAALLEVRQGMSDEEYYNKLLVIAELYLKGYDPDWHKPWFGCHGHRVGLPAYPFTQNSYWIPELDNRFKSDPVKELVLATLHPLTGRNTSDFLGQRFSTTLTGQEFFIKDHVIKGKQVLPAVGYLEMVRAAIIESTKHLGIDNGALCLKNMMWAQPVIVGDVAVQLHTALFLDNDHTIAFEVFSEPTDSQNDPVIYSQGIATFEEVSAPARLNMAELKKICNQPILSKEQCYHIFSNTGFDYGPAHQGLEVVYRGTDMLLAKLQLPAVIADTQHHYFLHPALLDAALQACLLTGTAVTEQVRPDIYLPFALDQLTILEPCTAAMWAVIRFTAGKLPQQQPAFMKQVDIELCNSEGKISVIMKGCSFRLAGAGLFNEQAEQKSMSKENDILLLEPAWKEEPANAGVTSFSYVQHRVFLCEPENSVEEDLQRQLQDVPVIVLQGTQKNTGQRYQSYVRRVFEEIQALLSDKPKGKILVQVVVFEKEDAVLFSGIAGLLKTARLENPHFTGQLIRIAAADHIIDKLKENAVQETDGQIRYTSGKREVATWQEVVATYHDGNIPWKEKGVYLITGGAGGLGFIFAKEIAGKVKNPSLVLTGRSPLSESGSVFVEQLRAMGARVEYRQADVSNGPSLTELINDIQQTFNGLNGIIHSAGIVRDNFIIKKSREELMAVLAPKVLGATYLDAATREIPLDLFILFSSVAACTGNAGQADYTAANAYLDAFAAWRNELVQLNKRSGHTIAINWPLWKEGGMQLEQEMEKNLLQQWQMSLLQTTAGIQSLYRAIRSGASQIMVAPGNTEELRQRFLQTTTQHGLKTSQQDKPADASVNSDGQVPQPDLPEKKVLHYFKELLSVTIKRPVEQIEADAAMEQYGIDSIMVMQMTRQLEGVFGTLPKILLFEYQNIQELAGYFLENYAGKLRELLRTTEVQVNEQAAVPAHPSPETAEERNTLFSKRLLSRQRPVFHASAKQQRTDTPAPAALDIAIIGVAGRYPQADNLQQFWNNLVNGKDCITEIPKDRWDYRLYFDKDKEKEGKSYSKWGGFLNDVDRFDPLFFNISPLEAERMDPQERLFLQCVYETLEDAGYTRHSVSQQKHFGLSNQVGVYVGVMYEEYQLFGAQETWQGNPVALWGLPSSIANRVSYFCDFHGPSMAVDTMCSSSLTAIHLACESIVRGKCDVAIAGGVNVSVHPNKYLFLSQGRFASSKGKCESFGIGGDGYVPGEGVGAVLLKPLQKAIADGDHVYGVIKSTAINHGGKTNGYTVPNPRAQSSAIGRAFKEAGIDPRYISYLEAHGTGTSLGDPIEIAGLSKTIQEYTADTQFCAIGSVKSNIGHCESAAGIAGVTKVLLQMKYRQIVPSLHSTTLNTNIDFANTPFVVQQKMAAWERPVSGKNGEAREHPLCAGISSFGAGGANAHIVIEEYIAHRADTPAHQALKAIGNHEQAIILLSAMDENRLEEQARQLLTALQQENKRYWKLSEELLADMAYTLQTGREHLESRLALLVTSIDELEQKLEGFLAGKRKIAGLFQGQASAHKTIAAALPVEDDWQENIKSWLLKKKYEKVVERWVKGVKVDWKILYEGNYPLRRISLPTYPFKKDRYWVGEISDNPVAFQPGKNQLSCIHPLLHENISDLTGQRFRVAFSGDEFYLKDHLVNGQKVLPAAAYLEMIREAIWQSVKALNVAMPDIQLNNIQWIQPMVVEEKGIQVAVELYLEANGEIGFEVYTNVLGEPQERDVFCHGTASVDALKAIDSIGEAGIHALQQACSNRVASKTACYEAFASIGFQYGLTHQGIEQAYIAAHKVLAKIALPSFAFDKKGVFLLHPGLMDAALQASLLLNWTDSNSALKMYLPVAAARVEVYAAVSVVAWVVISEVSNTTDEGERLLDIDILSDSGAFCVRLKDVSFKTPSVNFLSAHRAAQKTETLLLFPEWEKKEPGLDGFNRTFNKHIAILCGFKKSAAQLTALLPAIDFIALEPTGVTDFNNISLQVFETVRALLKEKEKGVVLVQVLVPSGTDLVMYGAISGLLKTAQKENPRFYGQVIRLSAEEKSEVFNQLIRENSLSAFDKEVRYQYQHRQVLKWHIIENEVTTKAANDYPWKQNGVYLITGGAGGLGFIFAHEIVQKANAVTLVLTGRSALSNAQQAKIAALQKLGATVYYKQADVTDQESVLQLIQYIRETCGSLHGIIHSAGITRDNFLINKTNSEWKEVLAPKVNGLQYLDLASKDIPLDVFIFFSSISGAVGNAGQADYATANAFMDEYAEYRSKLVADGVRYGRTLSVNWPLWQEGGMHVDEEAEKYLFDTMGITPLSTKAGIEALYRALLSHYARVIVVEGARENIVEKITVQDQQAAQTSRETPAPVMATDSRVMEEAIHYFKKMLSSVIKLPADKIKADVSLEEYGIDSVMVMKMTGKLEKIFGNVSKTLFYEYQNIRQLTQYFMEEHYLPLAAVLGIDNKKETTKQEPETVKKITFSDLLRSGTHKKWRSNASGRLTEDIIPGHKQPGSLDIAIVGLSGKYPQADNLEQFWENLCQGRDCITEVPPDRWDYTAYFDQDKNKPGKTYSKWGGFINGVDEFDPLLFNISPREAALIDPQERLFLQCVYETMEDAGYSRQTLAAADENALSGSVGVYVGVMYEEYQLFGAEESIKGRNIALFGNPSSIANRVSYFYNLNGPSMAIDTMCSSSLTAIHLACQAIQQGDCKAAIAGGVNISIHPNKYLLLAQGKFISGKGHCESFGIGGDGYVPAEGVGAVLLKPLAQAIADGDHVYGVIKATAVNHGGKTNGYTVPNPNAQAQVITQAYQRSGIDPRTISYLEAHGTGTSLGDPIEIAGLKKAYQEYTKDNGFCAIGSVKSNIGHGESAAGIAGITKILLQLKHKLLVPSLHSEVLNPHIDFANSPFVVQQELAEWKRPVIDRNGKAHEFLRRAGISSFGAGGSNAHVIIEEFDNHLSARQLPVSSNGTPVKEPVVILLSAKNKSCLNQLTERLLSTLQKGIFKEGDLPAIAFTLQTGREMLEVRLAIIVKSVEELCTQLASFLKGDELIDGLYHGKIERDNAAIEAFAADEELQEAVRKWIERKKYAKLCDFWVKGLPIDWWALYRQQTANGKAPARVSLPVYPFARERYWIARTGVPGIPVKDAGEPFKLLTFEETWAEQPVEKAFAEWTATRPLLIRTIVCFLSDRYQQKIWQEAFREMNRDAVIVFIAAGTGAANDSSFSYCIDRADGNAYKHTLQAIAGKYGKIDAFVYLWALEERACIVDSSPIVYLLQAIGANNLKNNKVLLTGAWNSDALAAAAMDQCYLESWIGFVRSAALVLPNTHVAVLYRQQAGTQVDFSSWAKLAWQELQLPGRHDALYKNGKRYTYRIQPASLPTGGSLLKQGGTYLVTGGLGGLGLLFAQHLAGKYHANLILTGRSPLDDQKQQSIDHLKNFSSKVVYLQADVCDAEKMKASLAAIRKEMGTIDGLIHAAGIEEEGTLLGRSMDRFNAVLSSKISGTILLDELLKDEPFSFVCYFSSAAALLGDFGSCDYAVSNRFQMAFARYRAQLQRAGLRKGNTIAINWPLWKDGGMNLKEADSTQLYLVSSGQRYLEIQEGMEVFEQLLVTDAPDHRLILTGKESKVHQFIGWGAVKQFHVPVPAVADHTENGKHSEATKGLSVEEYLQADIMHYVSELLKISKDRLDIHENLADLGFDSVTLTQLADLLSKHFTIEVVPALFFSYATIEKLTGYFKREYEQLLSTFYSRKPVVQTLAPPLDSVMAPAPVLARAGGDAHLSAYEPVAVIGMSGRFPRARNIEEMWKLLAAGENAITEIPADRFNWRSYYGGENIEEGKTNCKWTGFIPGIREFDPLFFEISPSEARLMDPRQRLLLQEGWRALEDAGYGKSHLEKNKIAFYVGVEEGTYDGVANTTITSNHNAILAARLSYFLNLSGPNMAINTACSSGLVAAHQAFVSLQQGECDTAIVAGVNLMITPEPYVAMSQAGMLSADGVCYTFDKRANGMVPGEAVAAIVCKRLSQAIADGDPIYATIVASGINYDGKTNGITAPGGLAQTALLTSVYDRYKVNPENIEYIVTHGTGTRLGDPVEINALYDAFKNYTNKQTYCALTSVKTNFGHTFAASGLVSLISLVQALRHEAIPASLHCTNDSEYINWNNSPFFINKSLRAWLAMPGKIRTGAVSAFGMSGTNAHLVIQDYKLAEQTLRGNEFCYYLLPLAAKTKEALDEKIQDMILALEDNTLEAATMASISYTLMAGRHHFKYRCVVIAQHHANARTVFQQAAKKEISAYYKFGEVPKQVKTTHEIKERIAEVMQECRQFRNDVQILPVELLLLAGFYCQGHEMPWEQLFPEQIPVRVHLPGYPFSRKTYWKTDRQEEDKNDLPEKATEVQVRAAAAETTIAGKEALVTATGQWLFTREELVATNLPPAIDWHYQLSRLTGKVICIVYTEEEEKEGILGLLRKMEKTVELPVPLTVKALPVEEVNAHTMKAMRPEIVLVAVAQKANGTGWLSPESATACVFRLSKSLMEAAWDEPVYLYYLYETNDAIQRLDSQALSGFFLSAMKENNQHVWKSIRVHNAANAMGRHQLFLKEWLAEEQVATLPGKFSEVYYEQDRRFVQTLIETTLAGPVIPAFRQNGTYLVAGGAGYIGNALLQQLATKYRATLVIVSRGSYDAARKEQCEKLRQAGARVHYVVCDITDEYALELLYRQIKKDVGIIHGVINLVRAHDSKSIAAKSWESFCRVSEVKIKGTLNVDRITANENLDIFLSFASIGAYGARGDSDYAYSVAFQNVFARYRNQLKKEGKRSGTAVSLCWGPWEEDKLFPESRKKMQAAGFNLIHMDTAFPWIEAASLYDEAVIGLCAVADKEKVKALLGISDAGKSNTPLYAGNTFEMLIEQWEQEKATGKPVTITDVQRIIPVTAIENMDALLVERIYNLCFDSPAATNDKNSLNKPGDIIHIIRSTVMDVLQIEQLDDEEPFQQYGLDSIKAMRLCTRLEKKLDREVPVQWLLEFPTVKELLQQLNIQYQPILT